MEHKGKRKWFHPFRAPLRSIRKYVAVWKHRMSGFYSSFFASSRDPEVKSVDARPSHHCMSGRMVRGQAKVVAWLLFSRLFLYGPGPWKKLEEDDPFVV